MMRSCSSFVLATVSLVILLADQSASEPDSEPFTPREAHHLGLFHPYQEKIPRHCWAPPRDIDPYKCCPIPRLYSDEVLSSCGVEKNEENDTSAVDRHNRRRKEPCEDGKCLMENSDLLLANKSVDYAKLRVYLNKWAVDNPEFTDAILAAIPICAKDGGSSEPICEHDRVFFCMIANILWNCKLRDEEGCQILREHMDDCKPHYMKPKDQEEEEKRLQQEKQQEKSEQNS
nr:uncharacterized protein LOC110372686 [Helicoverpa armigera]